MGVERERWAPFKGVCPMEKTVVFLLGCLASVMTGAPRAFAVLPPSNFEETKSTASLERVQGAIETLERDERQLAEILRAIKKDEEALKRALADRKEEGTLQGNPAPDSEKTTTDETR